MDHCRCSVAIVDNFHLERGMTDQCKHCTLRGNVESCESVPCFNRENWWAKQMISKNEQCESEITRLQHELYIATSELKKCLLGK